jgi:hypothetical protein
MHLQAALAAPPLRLQGEKPLPKGIPANGLIATFLLDSSQSA